MNPSVGVLSQPLYLPSSPLIMKGLHCALFAWLAPGQESPAEPLGQPVNRTVQCVCEATGMGRDTAATEEMALVLEEFTRGLKRNTKKAFLDSKPPLVGIV